MFLLPRSAPVLGVAFWLASVLAPSVQAQEKVPLKLNLKQGESYTTSMAAKQQISQTIGGNAQKTTQTIGFAVTLRPSKVDSDGTIHGTFKYDSVHLKSEGPAGKVDYDSARDKEVPANPMAKAFSALVGQTLDVVMTPRGEVKELKGAEKIVDAIIKSMDVPEAARGMVEQQMKSQFGEEALKKNFEQMTAVYPDKPVAVGDSWNVEQKMSTGMPMTLNTKYTLKSLSGGKATLEAAGTVKTDPDAPAGAVPGAKFDLKGKQNGSLVIDQATGWLTSGTLKQNLAGNIAIDAGGQKMDIPMTIQSDTTFGQPKE